MHVSIAREILLHDKVRFIITVVSLGFAIVMIVYDMMMFFGVTEENLNLVDRTGVQLWISEDKGRNFNAPSHVPDTMLRRARRMDGVEQACALSTLMGNLKIADNRQVFVVGIDPACGLVQPWSVAAGDPAGLRRDDTIVVDSLALRGEHVLVGDVVELNGREMRVVAITRGNKSFSSPYVYVNLHTFNDIGGTPGTYNFVAVRLAPDADPVRVARRLENVRSDVAVSAVREFRRASTAALVAQGVGMIFSVVFVGVLVGALIITLTIYTATMERLRDFAIVKALGATRWKVWGIVMEQAITEMAVSFVFGLAASWGLDYVVKTASGISVRFNSLAIAVSFVALIVLAMLGALLSIRKAVSVDPGIVFRA